LANVKTSSPLKLLGQMEPTLAGSIYVRFSLIWPGSFRGEDLFNSSQSETRIALGSHICWPNGTKRRNVIEELTEMLPAKFGSIWPSSFRGEFFLTLANQKQDLLLAAIFVGLLLKNLLL
jgi:hypothetical protein